MVEDNMIMLRNKELAFSILVILVLTIPTLAAYGQNQKVHVVILFKEKLSDKQINLVRLDGGEIKRSYHIINGISVDIEQDKINSLKNDPSVISVDPDLEVKALDLNADTQIGANQVWISATGQGIPVAILDTGVDTTHPEFAGRIALCHSEITNTDTCEDPNGHGTHVAGIGGTARIDPRAKGVATAVSLFRYQVLSATGSGSISVIIAGIDSATGHGAKVISMSLGTSAISTNQPNCDTAIPSLTTAINNAVAAGVTVVAAAGNSGIKGVGAPGCISSTIAVGAVDNTDTIASFSSVGGPMADHGIVAPGVNIFSSWLLDGYATLSGTSMATPHVAGTIALMMQSNPSLTPAQIKNTLFSTACTGITSPSCPSGAVPNSVYGHGRVDALAAHNAVVAQTAPGIPTGLKATTASYSSIVLSWTAPPNNGSSAITGYKIERSVDGGTSWSTIAANTGSTATTYSDNGLAPSTTYTYRVSAINSVGTSSPSNTASATTSSNGTAQATLVVKSVDLSGNSFAGMWTTIQSGGTTVKTGYTPVTFTATTGTQYTVTVSNYQNYVFNHWDDGSTNAARTITPTQSTTLTAYYSTGTTTSTVPSAPQNLQAAAGNAQVSLSWTAPSSNGGSAITNYKIYRSTSSGTETLLTTVGNVVSYTDGTVTNGQIYYYKVSAVNSVGESPQSNEASATPTAPPPPPPSTVPSAPQNLQAAAGNAQVSLSWTAPSSNGGSAITNYKIYRSTSSGTETLLTTVGNVVSYTDGTVTNGQIYYYKVSAVNSVGESPQSNEASATPTAPPPPPPSTVPSAPQNLQAAAGNAQVSLSWTAPSSNGGSAITNYKIYRSTSSGTETLQIGRAHV